MGSKWSSYDLATLRQLYEEEKEALSQSLLQGLSWEQLADQRRNVTDLSIAIHRKLSGGEDLPETKHPAGHQIRKADGGATQGS